jgi:hypothetical protein
VLLIFVTVTHPLLFWAFLRETRKRHQKTLRELDVWKRNRERAEQVSTQDSLMHAVR